MKDNNYSFNRVGCSEGGLLYLHHLKEKGKLDSIQWMNNPWKNMKWACRWLYNTAGLYDSTIDIHGNDEQGLDDIVNSPALEQWIDSYKTALKNSSFPLVLMHSGIQCNANMKTFIEEYKHCYVATHVGNWNWNTWHKPDLEINTAKIFEPMTQDINNWYDESLKLCVNACNNKRVLIVSNMGKTCEEQYIKNNNHNISSIGYVEYPSCFGNSGPDVNHMVTTDRVVNEINKIIDTYDVVILACGALAPIVSDRIIGDVTKITIGSGINILFNITPEMQKPSPGIFKIPKDIRPDVSRYYGNGIMKD